LNGPLSHSSPRVIGAAGNVVGDYYWGSWNSELQQQQPFTIFFPPWHDIIDNRSNKSRSCSWMFFHSNTPLLLLLLSKCYNFCFETNTHTHTHAIR
jgi:hypothetical protein